MTKWRVELINNADLEILLNAGWFLEKFQIVPLSGELRLVAILSRPEDPECTMNLSCKCDDCQKEHAVGL